jgi:multiple RNA-binding domain-containing protein 1
MSRLIVKNLPQTVTEQKLRDLFGQKGAITDIQLKYKDGKFRKFGFVGFEKEEEAASAVKFFDSTFIGTSKIKVEVCASLGDESKPKSWSKHTKEAEVNKVKKKGEDDQETPTESTKDSKKKSKNAAKIDTIIGDRKNDPMFKEFMKSHAKDKLSWENDIEVEKDNEEASEEVATSTEKLANKDITDEDYMKQLMGKSEAGKSEVKQPKVQFEKTTKKSKDEMVKLFTIKIRNLPSKVKREELIKFFRPSKAFSVRIPRTSGFAYVGFKLERDMQVRRSLEAFDDDV